MGEWISVISLLCDYTPFNLIFIIVTMTTIRFVVLHTDTLID